MCTGVNADLYFRNLRLKRIWTEMWSFGTPKLHGICTFSYISSVGTNKITYQEADNGYQDA